MKPDAHGWMPVETAPKDGSDILLWLPAPWDGVRLAGWCPRWECWIEGEVDNFDNERYGIGSAVPSHWMPCPAAPKAE
jgi:hypothetical protein